MTDATSSEILDRLRTLEDRAEIGQLIASYGPSVDSGSGEETASLWLNDGRYEFSAPANDTAGADVWALDGHDEFVAMVHGDHHQHYILHGSAHFVGMPHIVVDGDRAIAITYSLLILHDQKESKNVIDRMGSNRWELARTQQGWRVAKRTQSILDGRPESRDLLRDAAGKTAI